MKTIEQILEQPKYGIFKDVTKYVGICSYLYQYWPNFLRYVPKEMHLMMQTFINSTDLVKKHQSATNHYSSFVFVKIADNNSYFNCTREKYTEEISTHFPTIKKPLKGKFLEGLQALFIDLVQESLHLCDTSSQAEYDRNSFTPKLKSNLTISSAPIEIISVFSFILFARLGICGLTVQGNVDLAKSSKSDQPVLKFNPCRVNFDSREFVYSPNLMLSDNYAYKFYVPDQFNQTVIDEMKATVLEHLKHIPDVKIVSLNPTYFIYTPSGGFEKTTSILNPRTKYRNSGIHIVDTSYNSYNVNNEKYFEDLKSRYSKGELEVLFYYLGPIIYSGFAWQIQIEIEGKQLLKENEFIYFTDYKSFEESYRNNPELEELVHKFKDRGLVFLSSSFCQRTGSQTYNSGVDMQGPLTKNQTLMEWIITSLIPKGIANGHKFNFTNTTNGSSQAVRCRQIEKILTFNRNN